MQRPELYPLPLLGTCLTSTEAAAIIGVLCQHVLKAGLTHLPQLAPSDLSITDDGDLHIPASSRDTAQLKPALEAMTGLLKELIEVVDAPAAELRLAQRRSDRCAQVDAFADVAELGEWMVRSFQLTDSRIVLREVPRRLKAQADEPIIVALDMAHGIDEFPSESTNVREQNAPVQGSVPAVHASATSSNPRSRRNLSAGLTLLAAGLAALAIADLVNDDRKDATRTVPTATATVRELPPSHSREAPRHDRSTPLDAPNRREEGTRSARVVPPAVATAPRDPANAEPRRLAVPGIVGPVFSPSYSPNGSALFFHAGREPSARMVSASFDDTGALVEVTALSTDAARNYHVRLSPDGQQLAFDSDRDGERAVYVGGRDGTDVRKVSGDGFAAVPTWSPDGGRLAFVRAEHGRARVWNLWLLHLASGEMRRLTSYRVGQMWGASWFPDGSRIAYSHETSLHVLDLSTGGGERFASPVRGRLPRTPAVSPQGDRIVFQVHGDGVWMLELADGSMRRILSDPSAEEFTWHPSGGRLAYHSRLDGRWGIWITSAPVVAQVRNY